ncbi:SDR family oxidoreductase [Pedobacter sp. CG_S7]|uniref:SDR family oxidoreductase n=1 Tax=Pedobacter sp. CG_S7 TaxID=3143930 RepID=UPI003399DE4A
MNISLENKCAVICGGSQGIGFATAMALAASRASCILIARNEAALQEAVAKLPTTFHQKHLYKVADFSDTAAVKIAIEEITSGTNIEILVNNSGGPKPGPITDANPEAFKAAFNQHVICNQILVNAVIPGMRILKYGRIINIISTSVKTPLPNLGVSNTIRAAVASWAKTLANEIGKYNITVNNILPGLTNTSRLESLVKQIALDKGIEEKQVKQELIGSIPMRRFAEPKDIASVICFLASPAAAYVNGINIPVDGGRTPTL